MPNRSRSRSDADVTLADGTKSAPRNSVQFAGYAGDPRRRPKSFCVGTAFTSSSSSTQRHPSAKADAAGISDVVLESAITTIMDCEDSVAAVDAEDKVLVYRNWLGLMKGDLEEEVTKGGRAFTRRLNPDRAYTAPDGATLTLPGRSLMLVRQCRAPDDNPRSSTGREEVPEGLMDAMVRR